MEKTLPAYFYVDPTHFKQETERFFANQWVCVGRANSIPKIGDFFVRNFLNESILLVRQETGVQALYNVCRHRGTRLCEKEAGNFPARITCPYHAWSYGLDGKLVKAPHMAETPGFSVSDYSLHTAHCETWEGHLFIHLGTPPRSVNEQLSRLTETFKPWDMAELQMAKRISYSVAANWKLIIQNYSECMHCPIIHPALQKLSHYLSGQNEEPCPEFLGGTMELKEEVSTLALADKKNRQPFPGLGEKEKTHIYYYWISPNMLISLHPDYLLTHTLWPKGTNQTEVICEWHFHPSEMKHSDFDPSDAVDFWDMTNRQDWHVSELSQLGIQSRVYAPGPYSVRENLLPYFDKIIRE